MPDKNPAAHRVLSVAKAMRDNGVEVVFLGMSKTNREKDVLKTRTEVQEFKAYSVPYPESKKEWVRYLTDISAVIKLIESLGGADGIICYNYQAIAFEKLRKYCKANGIKIYSDCTEWYNTVGASAVFKMLKGFDIWYRMNIVQKKLDGMIVISNYLKNFYSGCKNVAVVPPLVDTNEEKWQIPAKNLGNDVNFLYSGNPGVKDRVDEIVRAFVNIQHKYAAQLWVIGVSEQDFFKYNSSFKKEEIPPTVRFLGRIPHEENLAYLKGADCSMIIRNSTRTNNAGFPTKFVEAVTLGVGVIATDISDIKDYVGKADNLVMVENSIEEAMIKFIGQYNAEKTASDIFDYRLWQNSIMRLIE